MPRFLPAHYISTYVPALCRAILLVHMTCVCLGSMHPWPPTLAAGPPLGSWQPGCLSPSPGSSWIPRACLHTYDSNKGADGTGCRPTCGSFVPLQSCWLALPLPPPSPPPLLLPCSFADSTPCRPWLRLAIPLECLRRATTAVQMPVATWATAKHLERLGGLGRPERGS